MNRENIKIEKSKKGGYVAKCDGEAITEDGISKSDIYLQIDAHFDLIEDRERDISELNIPDVDEPEVAPTPKKKKKKKPAKKKSTKAKK